ncbi:MAG: acyl-CoA dehydrogenase family protein [Planctomycetales bacterium]|nr:acyl-CoA dehydrogenase family protein [Planctomycetales bacterium]
MIRATVREFAEKEVAPKAAEIDRTQRFPVETFRRMAELGLLAIPLPEEYGGAGADYLSYVLAMEELARVCASTALTLAAHYSLGTWPIYGFGSEATKRRYIPDLAGGRKIGAYGLTEPNAGSDAGGTRTTAIRKGDRYILNGSKTFITNGTYADSFVVSAKSDPSAQGSRGISAFVLEKGWKGFTVQKGKEKLGMRGSDWAELYFQDVEVPVENRLAPEHQGFQVFMKTLDAGRISIGALGVGIAQGALEAATAHARERKAFGQPIGSFQAVGNMIADMATEVRAARLLVYSAAKLKDEGKPHTAEGAMAKLFSSEVAMRATHSAIQVYGGYGFVNEYPVERFYRDAKLCEIGEGTSEIQRIVIARHVLGRFEEGG